MGDFHGHTDGEFEAVTRALRAQRPEATALELDRMKLDARRRAARTARSQLSQKGLLMRSRLFITALVAGGLLMLGGGAALGVSGLSSTRSASIAQYGTTTTSTGVVTTTTTTQVVTTPPVTTTETQAEEPEEENLGDDEGDQKPAGEVQGAKQVAAEELPFTGYLAIPILVLGLAMLATGLVLRRSRRRIELDS